jgi:hypothetical protein
MAGRMSASAVLDMSGTVIRERVKSIQNAASILVHWLTFTDLNGLK